MTLTISFAGPGKCGAMYEVPRGYGIFPAFICSRERGHDGDHEDATRANPLHEGLPTWNEETP